MKCFVKESLVKLGATKKKVAPNVYLLLFDDRQNMCKTFLRFAEHYESPQFRNKIFSLSEFKEWYKTTRNGKFTYYDDWGGFNVPSYVFVPFRDGRFKYLSDKEKLLLNSISKIKEPFYLIAAQKGTSQTIQHELSHGLFYTNEEYRENVLKLVEQFDHTEAHEYLIKQGYCEEVIQDELNAYAVSGRVKVDDEFSKQAKKLFKKYRKLKGE